MADVEPDAAPATVPLVRPGTARALRRTLGPLAEQPVRPVSAFKSRPPDSSRRAAAPSLGVDALVAYQAAMLQRPVVAPVAVSDALRPFARRDLLASQAQRVSSAKRSGAGPVAVGIALTLVKWQQQAREGLQAGIDAAAEAEEAAGGLGASAVVAAGPGDDLDWSAFDAAAPSTARARPMSSSGRRGGGGGVGARPLTASQPPNAYDRYLLRRAQEAVEAQNETDIDRALQQWRENKTAVDAEIERRIQARRRPRAGAWGGGAGGGGSTWGSTDWRGGGAASPSPARRAGGGDGEDDLELLRGAGSPQQTRRGGSGAPTPGWRAPPDETAALPFAATRTARVGMPQSVAGGGEAGPGPGIGVGPSALPFAESLGTSRPSMMQWWGTQVRAQQAAAAAAQWDADEGGRGGGGGGGSATDGRPWSAWATARAVLPPRSAAESGAALAALGVTAFPAMGGGLQPPPSPLRPSSVAGPRLHALLSAAAARPTAATVGEMTAATSGVDVLVNAPAIRYHMYEEARAEHARVQERLDAAAAAGEMEASGAWGGPPSPTALSASQARADAHAAASDAAARALLPPLSCVSLDAAKAQFDAIPQTRVAPYAGPDPAAAAAAAKGGAKGKAPAKPAPKAAPKRPATAGAALGGKGGGLPPGVAFAVDVGPRQWAGAGAASTYCFSENPLILEKRLQGIRDDALGIGKKKKKGGAAKKKK